MSKMKNKLDGILSRLANAEEKMSVLKNIAVETFQNEIQRKNTEKKMNRACQRIMGQLEEA